MIKFRLVSRDDMPSLLEILQHEEVGQRIIAEPMAVTPESFPAILMVSKPGTYARAFTILFEAEVIGFGAIGDIDSQHRTATISWLVLDPKVQGRFYGVKAGRFLIDYAFNTLNRNRLDCKVMAENRTVRAVIKRCGGKFEGAAREAMYKGGKYWDMHQYSWLRSEWELGNGTAT